MTNDDIIRMAREAGLVMYDYSDPSLERFANLVAAAERNRTGGSGSTHLIHLHGGWDFARALETKLREKNNG